MTSREEAARQALHAELEQLARGRGRGPFEIRVMVEDGEKGRRVESTTERGPNIKRKGAPK